MILLHIDADTRATVAEVGGKCANLIELHRMGLNVPGTTVLTTAAYETQALRCGLDERIAPLMEQQDWAGAARAAQAALLDSRMDAALADAIAGHYARMGSPVVAVRSSATSEDQEGASAAGQYESFLNVQGEQALLAAITKCWASLWGRRAMAYRARRGIDQMSARMAVIIQEMVPAEAAGVAFTQDPLQPDDNHIRVEIVPGLGEPLVSGDIAGDVYRINRSDPRRVQNLNTSGLLTPRLAEELGGMALRIEERFNAPQDIEFALFHDAVHILQSRPMTGMASTAPDPLEALGKPSYMDKLIKPFADERYVIAPKPLDIVVVNLVLGAHLYAITKGGASVDTDDEERAMARIWRQAYRLPPIRQLWKMYYKGVPQLFRQLELDWLGWWESGPSEQMRAISDSTDTSALDDSALFARADALIGTWKELLHERIYASGGIHAEAWLRLLVTLAVGPKQRASVMSRLMTGIESPTLDLNRELWRISRLVRSHPESLAAIRDNAPQRLKNTAKGQEILAAFESFIEEHGHREGTCWYLTTPTWRHDRRQVWHMIESLADADVQLASPTQESALRDEALALVERRLRWIPGLKKAFRWLWRHLYGLNAFREKSHYDLTRGLDALQGIVMEYAGRLLARGLLEQESDIGYFTYEELRGWAAGEPPAKDALRATLDRRRATYRLVNANWQVQRSGTPAKGKTLKGIAASPGLAQGRVRIILGEHDFAALRAGEVLVCPYTNPAWTPLFAMAAAVVTETGGLSSHAAIVAREYGIPAVMNVRGATRTLKQGREIRVDGDRGQVLRLR